MTKTFEYKYKIGQKVYHIIPDSPEGVITDIRFSFCNNRPAYLVSLGFSDECICEEHELSETKNF